MCQRACGAPFIAFIRVAGDIVTWSTNPKTFASFSGVERRFCSACGTPLTDRWIASSNISPTLNSLDDTAAAPTPTISFETESKAVWLLDLTSLRHNDCNPATAPGFVSHQTP